MQISIVIPCHNEPDILPTLNSLNVQNGTLQKIQVIIVVNHSVRAPDTIVEQNQQSSRAIRNWIRSNPNSFLNIHLIQAFNMPSKHAGVGLARKLGMDKAVNLWGNDPEKLIIANLDADCLVADNYLQEIHTHFLTNPKLNGASIHYEHQLDHSENIQAVVAYEMHLRLYEQALIRIGYPFAFQTVGSAMACRASAYIKQGGMNKRKAGEDFYFIQKILKLGGYKDIVTTSVFPSNRVSTRVPFGTGKAIGDYLEQKKQWTYDYRTYQLLEKGLSNLEQVYASGIEAWKLGISPGYFPAFENAQFLEALSDALANSTTFGRFRKRFYMRFDGFQVMKFMHYCRDHFWPNLLVIDAAELFLGKSLNSESLLTALRNSLKHFPKYLDTEFNVKRAE